MKTISHFGPEDFLTYLLSKIDRVTVENNNYQHTHDRVWYNPETGHLQLEEICNNGEGSVFGRGVYGNAIIPIEWNHLLPDSLLQTPNWGDF